MLLGSVITKYSLRLVPPLETVTELVGTLLLTVLQVDLPTETVGLLFTATTLCFFWGVFYHLSRH